MGEMTQHPTEENVVALKRGTQPKARTSIKTKTGVMPKQDVHMPKLSLSFDPVSRGRQLLIHHETAASADEVHLSECAKAVASVCVCVAVECFVTLRGS